MTRLSLPLAALLALASPALAEQGNDQPVITVIDGDTLRFDGERIRLRSEAGPIDAPELRKAQCPLELFRAEAARDRLREFIGAADKVAIKRTGADRYGRTVAVAYVGGRDVGALLVREGHAKPWPTLRRADRPTWCGPS